MSLIDQGWAIAPSEIDSTDLKGIREAVFDSDFVGQRCLLDHPRVHDTALQIRNRLIERGVLKEQAIAIQAIAFNKSVGMNWKVAWHQDVIFPFAQPVSSPGFDLPTKKEGIDYARPPVAVLNGIVAVRLHLDDCDESNGPLRVSPGTHRYGILSVASAGEYVKRHGEIICVASAGELLLMSPLVLHTSSMALQPNHRRVLHIVYHSGMPISERWYRSVGPLT